MCEVERVEVRRVEWVDDECFVDVACVVGEECGDDVECLVEVECVEEVVWGVDVECLVEVESLEVLERVDKVV